MKIHIIAGAVPGACTLFAAEQGGQSAAAKPAAKRAPAHQPPHR